MYPLGRMWMKPGNSKVFRRRVVVTCPSCGVRTFRWASLSYACEGCVSIFGRRWWTPVINVGSTKE